jgi:hypothetical protein
MFIRRIALLLGLLGVATACGAASGQGIDPPVTAPVGELPPAADSTTTATVLDSSTVPRTTVPIAPDAQVGALVAGNRVMLIGDSVMASTSERYGGEMCGALVPLGWQAEVDAESGRFIDFGKLVVDKRLDAGWDVSVILLGNNYGDNQDVFRQYLDDMVGRLSPQPVVLLTVTEFKPSRVQVNDVIFEMAQKYPNVVVVDWAAVTAADPLLTGPDHLHLTEPGRAALAAQVAFALGHAPVEPGKCLPTNFRDDSSATNVNPQTTVKKPAKTTTSVAATVATTPKPTAPGTTAAPPPPTVTSPPVTTNPPATNPPATDPPPTPPANP